MDQYLKNIGKNGFGFDPIFIPKSYKITFGQMLNPKKLKWTTGLSLFVN